MHSLRILRQEAALLIVTGALCLAGAPTRAAAQAPDVIYANHTRDIASAPTYMGSSGGTNGCNTRKSTAGREPDTQNEKYPLFLYFVGTLGDYRQAASSKAVVEAMAQRGYVAVQVQYDHGAELQPMQLHYKAACLFDPDREQSLVTKLCALPNVDCSLGITTWGHSQGAALAAMAGSYDGRVRAAFLTGFGQGFNSRAWTREFWLQADRIRLVNGEADQGIPGGRAAIAKVSSEITGVSCAESPCLMENGAGWLTVYNSDVTDRRADHCWFMNDSSQTCSILTAAGLGPNDPRWTTPWTETSADHTLEKCATWLNAEAPVGPQPALDYFWIEFASLPLQVSYNGTTYPVKYLENIYPWGTIDWGTSHAFNLESGPAGPDSVNPVDSETRHISLGASDAPATGEFSLYGAQGRRVGGISVYYPGRSDTDEATAEFSVQIEHVDGSVDAPIIEQLAPREWTLVHIDAPRARKVTVHSERGNLVKIESILLQGTAP